MSIPIEEAMTFIAKRREDRQIFSIKFIKRSTGLERKMLCKFGSPVEDGQPRYNPKDHNLVWVREMKNGWKSIPLDGIVSIKLHGKDEAVDYD